MGAFFVVALLQEVEPRHPPFTCGLGIVTQPWEGRNQAGVTDSDSLLR